MSIIRKHFPLVEISFSEIIIEINKQLLTFDLSLKYQGELLDK